MKDFTWASWNGSNRKNGWGGVVRWSRGSQWSGEGVPECFEGGGGTPPTPCTPKIGNSPTLQTSPGGGDPHTPLP